ncbi:ankyrin [Hyaloscypha bicolor E]|uniref:Ankyrin n=1 Tax=Hyaloscypha bicolor E TaxID=1095630 RepID=A0A2J6TJ15_9HELO|nr:ankyrin [Hyaloscypha bicolor E]PMD63001.1 ankyrin [Hyaloscypha bicolor E]
MCHFSDPASQKWISFSSAVVNLARANAETTAILDPPLIRYREELNKWLDPLPMVDDYNRIRDLRLENTCQWINQESKFLAWRSSSRRNVDLWVRGPPGCSKSTLAASIIDQLSVDQPTAYFFCNVEDPDRSDFTRILKTLTWQLVLKKPHFADGIYDIFLETAGAATPIESYKRALAGILKDGEPCYIVIDGLDECRGKYSDISKAMFHISSHAKLLVISRWMTWIEQCFPLGSMTSTLDIATTHTSRDISLFVDSKTQELDLDPELVDKLSILLIAKANGMFLWVKLTIEYLSQQATLEDTIEALKNLPKDLEALYERLVRRLQELPQSRYKLACKLIQWTFSSLRPLSLEQLKIALSITPGDNRQKYPNNILNLEKFVRESCSPLLELDEAKGTVRFVHASAVDFFSRSTRPASHFKFMEGEEPAFTPEVTNPYCASVCLTYLSIEDIEFVPEDRDPRVYNRNLDKHLARYPFLQYCVLNWWKHLSLPQSGPGPTAEALGNTIRSFTSSQKCIVRWMQLFQLLDGLHEEGTQATLFRSPESPYAWRFADKDSLFHNLWLAPSGLFTRWQCWRTEIFFNGNYSTPIGITSFFDFLDVVRLECERGKNKDERDPIGLTPAMLAAHGEAPNVLQYAIENGADTLLISVFGYGIARYAARNSPSILPKVLDLGIPVGVPTLDNGTTSIHAACTTAGFHPSVLPQLLKRSSKGDLNTKSFSGRTALHLAASINIQSYARLVFDRGMLTAGALPNHRRLHSGSTEEAFMPSTRAEVETWLHSWNSYFATESIGSDTESLACHASELNEDNIARVVRKIKAFMVIWLVESGASIEETDSEGKTALDIVLKTGFAEDLEVIDGYCLRRISKALVALGAVEVNPKGPTALEVALLRGHWVTVKSILQGDAAASKLSENDRRFLSTSMEKEPKTQKDSTSAYEEQYQPRSPKVALHTSFILRFCLKKYSRPSRYHESIYVKLSTLIVDFAECWVKTSDLVTSFREARRRDTLFRSSVPRDRVEVSVPIADGELRKVSIYVFSSSYRSDSDSFGMSYYTSSIVVGPSSNRSRYTPKIYYSWPTNPNSLRRSTPDIPAAPILDMVRQPVDTGGVSLIDQAKEGLGLAQEEAIMVPSESFEVRDTNPFSVNPFSDDLFSDKCWVQTWYLPVSMRDRASLGPQGILNWLTSISPRDSIRLRPTQDFFAHDVALYGGFGIEIYCAWI